MNPMRRREFLATGAGLLIVGFNWTEIVAGQAQARRGAATGVAPTRGSLAPEDLDTWLTIAAAIIYTADVATLFFKPGNVARA